MEKVIVHTGSLSDGVHFFGPFDTEVEALKFMESVHPSLKADWAYLEDPPTFTDEPIEGVIEGHIIEVEEPESIKVVKKVKDKGNILELPASSAILNEKGKLIGYQTIIPGA